MLAQAQLIDFAKYKNYEKLNCILLEGQEQAASDKIITFLKNISCANYSEIDVKQQNLLDTLEKLEKTYQKTGVWNLLHAKNMDELINTEISDRSVIESMKAIMTSVAQDYKTTIVFDTKNSKVLDEIALDPNRIDGHYYVDKMKHLDEFFSKVCDFYATPNTQEIAKKKLCLKGAGIGALIGAGALLLHVFIKKNDIKLKGDKNENKQ